MKRQTQPTFQKMSLEEFDEGCELLSRKVAFRVAVIIGIVFLSIFATTVYSDFGPKAPMPVKKAPRLNKVPFEQRIALFMSRWGIQVVVLLVGAAMTKALVASCQFQCPACTSAFDSGIAIKKTRELGRCGYCREMILTEVADPESERRTIDDTWLWPYGLAMSILSVAMMSVHWLMFPIARKGMVSGSFVPAMAFMGCVVSGYCAKKYFKKSLPGILIGGIVIVVCIARLSTW